MPVSVHVGELHTTVVTEPPSAPLSPPMERSAGESDEARRRREWLRQRVAAEGFDD
jgi:hypothetical protein